MSQKHILLLIGVLSFLSTFTPLAKGDQVTAFDSTVLNHNFPEIKNNAPVYTPIVYEPYFKTERAIFNYYPRFEPSYVSFDLKGRPYLQYGSFIIEKLNNQGRWEYQDVLPVIDAYIRNTLGYVDYLFDNCGQNNEPIIRFDKDGDAYMSCYIEDAVKVRGTAGGNRLALLLHSRDNMATWTVYLLPSQFARFEKLDGHNLDCLNRPPVILLSDPANTVAGAYITIPEKKPDGTLTIPAPVKFTDKIEGVGCHSGDGNIAITHGNKVFFVYYEMRNYSEPNHPQYNMTYEYGGKTVNCRTGTPSFARTYDITTKTLSEPVFIGWGGHELDGHNLPVISMDSKGYLHVIVNGHHNPFLYAVSAKPYSTEAWKDHQLVSSGTSYASINCDKDDTLYAVTRCSRRGYVFEMALHRKKYGQPWETENYLVTPFKAFYRVWFHRMTLDTQTNRLFLTYYSQGGQIQLFKDDYLAYMNIWPDREHIFLTPNGYPWPGLNGGKVPDGMVECEMYRPPHGEMCTLVSEDSGNTWRLAITNDFRTPASAIAATPKLTVIDSKPAVSKPQPQTFDKAEPNVSKLKAITPEMAMGFECEGAWSTEADFLANGLAEKDLTCLNGSSVALHLSLKALTDGVKLAAEPKKAGKFSGKWADHARFPTMSTKYVEKDWSAYKKISFWIYSEVKTNEEVFIVIMSDSDKTKWKDFFFSSFKVDWTGWKMFDLSLSDFKKYEEVAGWNKIDSIGFYTKIFNKQPNPYTVLYIDDIRLEK